MSRAADDLQDELMGHMSRLSATELMDDAYAECTSYRDSMDDLMDGMMGDLDALPCMGHEP